MDGFEFWQALFLAPEGRGGPRSRLDWGDLVGKMKSILVRTDSALSMMEGRLQVRISASTI
jgi:hypothetical protein